MSPRLALAALLLLAAPVGAGVITFDFASLKSGAEGPLPGNASTATVNGVTITAFSSAFTTQAPIYVRNVTNDHGAGICSEPSCNSGDTNEISQLTNQEVLRLERPANTVWSSLWVSSLDSNGGVGAGEKGIMWWSNSATAAPSGIIAFQYGDFGTKVEGDLLSLASFAGFDRGAQYLFFRGASDTPGAAADNDFLVWKGSVNTIPTPAALGLLGAGLLGIGLARRLRLPQAD